MAQQTSVTLGGGATGSIREDLANFVSNIDRDETPLMSSAGSTKATSTYHDWLTDSYADPIAQTVAEGAAFATTGGSAAAGTDATQSARTRLRNYTQIFRSQIEVSNTAIAADTAGIANEFSYQLKKKGVEVRRNAERQGVLVGANAVGDETGAVRRLAGLLSWVGHGNVVNASGGAITYTEANAGKGTHIPTGAGNVTAMTRDHVESLMTAMYRNGGKPNMLMTSATNKTAVSALLSSNSTTSERRVTSMEKKLNLAVTGVVTDFGFDMAIVPNYIMDVSGGTNAIYAWDSSMVMKAVLRPLNVGKLDDSGDGKRAIITEECTLEVKNPNSVGVILNAS